MADEATILAEAAKLPIDERAAHSNWKVRSAAYEYIKTKCSSVFDPSDPCLADFGEFQAVVWGYCSAVATYCCCTWCLAVLALM
jgi:cytoskeleton-associated protein 5